jgi:hypothetical protein
VNCRPESEATNAMRFRSSSSAALVPLLFGLSGLLPGQPCGAQGVEKYQIQPQVSPGLRTEWTGSAVVGVTVNGTKTTVGIEFAGVMAYTEVDNGRPTTLDLTLSKCVADRDGIKQGCSGARALVVRRRGQERVSVENADGYAPEFIEVLKKILDLDMSVYPNRGVAVGEEWLNQLDSLPPEFMEMGFSRGGVKSKLAAVADRKGRRTFDIGMTGLFLAGPDSAPQARMTLNGLWRVDAGTGLPVGGESTIALSGSSGTSAFDMEMKMAVDCTFLAADSRVSTANQPAAPVPAGVPAPSADNPFGGAYKGPETAAILVPEGLKVSGTLSLRGRLLYPLQGVVDGTSLRGTFRIGDERFPFVATLEGDVLTFTTDGGKYTMKRQ